MGATVLWPRARDRRRPDHLATILELATLEGRLSAECIAFVCYWRCTVLLGCDVAAVSAEAVCEDLVKMSTATAALFYLPLTPDHVTPAMLLFASGTKFLRPEVRCSGGRL